MQFPFWSWLIASPHAFPGERLKHGAVKPWPVFRWFNDYNNKVIPWLCSMLPSSVVWCSMAAIKKGVKDEKDVFPNVYPGECSERNMHVRACVCSSTAGSEIHRLQEHWWASSSGCLNKHLKPDYTTAHDKYIVTWWYCLDFPVLVCWLVLHVMLHLIQLCYCALTRILRKVRVIGHLQGKNPEISHTKQEVSIFSLNRVFIFHLLMEWMKLLTSSWPPL